MSGIEVTPDVLRAVASWLPCESTADEDAVDALRRHALHLEREQAEEKRIDELARISYAAEAEAARGSIRGQQVANWDEASDLQKDVTRAGIRAVLAKLDEATR